MGFFDKFQYTNFHEMNLDWILKTIKSYDNTFKEIKKEWEELWKYVNSFPEEMYSFMVKTNSEIATINMQMVDLKRDIENTLHGFDNKFSEEILNLSNLLQTNIITLKSDITMLYRYVDHLHYQQKLYIDNQDENIIKYVNDKIDDKLVKPVQHIISPFDHYIETVQEFADAVYNVLRFFALNAWEYRALYWTAEEYDKLNLSAWVYDIYAKFLFGKWPWQKDSPMCLTASEYDSLEMEAQYFDNYPDMMCWKYDERSVWIFGIKNVA